jgi:hypothetical protein
MGEHLAQLNACLAAREVESERSRRFVEAFIRPFGLDVAATPRFADEVEALAAQPASVPRRGSRLLRVALSPLAALSATSLAESLVASERERAIAARHAERRGRAVRAKQDKAERKAAQWRDKRERAAVRQRHKATRAAEWRRAKLTKKWKRRIGLGQ